MAGLFVQVADNLTDEQKMNIVKNKGVPRSNEKHVEEKTYCVIFRSCLLVIESQLTDSEMAMTGEALIVNGRYNCFTKIKEYLECDGEYAVDLRNSLVMVEGVDAANAISLYRFIIHCNKFYSEEAIDENILNHYIDEVEVTDENKPQATGNGNYCGTLLREEII